LENGFVYKYPQFNNKKYPELDLWKMSKEYREQIINERIPDSIECIGITKLIPRDKDGFENTVKNKVNDGVMGSTSVSNVGKFQKLSSDSKRNSFVNKWKINDLIFYSVS